MSNQGIEFLSSVGRIVWGHPMKSQVKTDQATKQPVLRDGKQVEQWAFGLAIEKSQFQANEWPHLHQAASMLFPHGVPPQFSWKYKDGDGIDRKGQPYNKREGHAGCYVLTISTEAFCPQVFKRESNGQFRQIEAHEIKTGDYVRVMLNIKANAPTNASHTPGVYVNPKAIELVGYGTEIISGGVDPDEAFGAPVAALPPGASATPIASTSGAMPPGMMQNAPATQATTNVSQSTAQLPPPAHDFVNNALGQGQPQPGFTPQAAPAAAGHGGMSVASQQVGYAPNATSYPSNPGLPPGMPQTVPQR